MEQPQIIQLLNKKIIIKSKDNTTINLELVITDGVLEIIPITPILSTEEDVKDKTKTKNPKPLAILPSLSQNVSSTYQDPLQNHMILKNIGRYLSPVDLASARLTNKSWSNSLKYYQTIKLSSTTLKAFLQHQESANRTESSQFSNYTINDISFNVEEISTLFKLHGKYMSKLKILLSSTTTELNLDQFRNHILACTPNLTEFIMFDSSENQMFPNKFWNQGPLFNEHFPRKLYLPKLRKIKLRLCTKNENFENDGFMTDFLNSTNNLEYLSFSSGDDPNWLGSNPNKAIVSALSNKTSLEHFIALKLDYLTHTEILELIKLSERKINRLRLNEFKFDVPNQAPHGRTISAMDERFGWGLNKFLQLQSNTLKILHINISDNPSLDPSPWFTIHLPILNVLEEFKFRSLACIKGMKCSFDGGSILNNFPCLRKLDYNSGWIYEESDDRSEMVEWEKHMTLTIPHTLVEKLHFYNLNDYKKLYRLSELFPNVTKLVIEFDSMELIKGLRNKWSQLQSLTIGCDEEDNEDEALIDEYITGIPKEHHNTCLSLCKSSNYCTDDLMKKFKMMPGISDLKYLTNLRLMSNITISDVSAYFGILHPKFSCTLTHFLVKSASNLSVNCQRDIHQSLGSKAYIHLG